jgi:hypothetical protein
LKRCRGKVLIERETSDIEGRKRTVYSINSDKLKFNASNKDTKGGAAERRRNLHKIFSGGGI